MEKEMLRAMAALEESEKRFRDMANFMPLIVFEVNSQGKMTYVNEKAYSHLGYEKADFEKGMSIFEVLVPSDIERALSNIIKIASGQSEAVSVGNEYGIIKKDGTVFPGLVFSGPIEKDGEIVGLRGVIIDITKRKEREEASRMSEEKFCNLFESMPTGYYLSTHEGHYVDANPAFIKMLGYETLEDLQALCIPQDVYVEEKERAGHPLNQDFINRVEVYRHKRKDGRIIWIEDNARYIKNENGEVAFHEGFCQEITERIEALKALEENERKFRGLFENIGDGYYCTTPYREFVDANPAFVRMLGYNSLEELKQVPVNECYFAPEERRCAYVEEHSTEFSGQWEIYRLKKKDGVEVWVEDMARYVLDENGKVVFHQGICRDITERKKAEKLLLQKEREKAILELLNDLSQPLMIMSGASSNMMVSLIEGNISDKDIKSFEKAFERFGNLRRELLFRTVTA